MRACMQRDELPVPRVPSKSVPPTLVLGASEDKIVDAEDCHEVAQCFETQARILEGSGHDVMLDGRWQDFATEIAGFVRDL
jgi:esterase/lipase